MQRYRALRVSIQSDDAGRRAIADADADLATLEELLVPEPGRRLHARALHAAWQRESEWKIYEHVDEPVELAPDGAAATARYVLKASHGLDRLHWECEDRWRKRDGVWYLDRHRETRVASVRKSAPGPVLPDAPEPLLEAAGPVQASPRQRVRSEPEASEVRAPAQTTK
jgi:hypothetical protein